MVPQAPDEGARRPNWQGIGLRSRAFQDRAPASAVRCLGNRAGGCLLSFCYQGRDSYICVWHVGRVPSCYLPALMPIPCSHSTALRTCLHPAKIPSPCSHSATLLTPAHAITLRTCHHPAKMPPPCSHSTTLLTYHKQ